MDGIIQSKRNEDACKSIKKVQITINFITESILRLHISVKTLDFISTVFRTYLLSSSESILRVRGSEVKLTTIVMIIVNIRLVSKSRCSSLFMFIIKEILMYFINTIIVLMSSYILPIINVESAIYIAPTPFATD